MNMGRNRGHRLLESIIATCLWSGAFAWCGPPDAPPPDPAKQDRSPLQPGTPVGKGEDYLTDAKQVLGRAREAILAVQMVRYDAVFQGTGFMALNSPAVRGTAFLAGKLEGGYERFRFQVRTQMPEEPESPEYVVGSNGRNHFLIDHQTKRVHQGTDVEIMGPRLNLARAIAMQEFVHPEAFIDDLKANYLRVRGTTMVGDQECYEIYINDPGNKGELVWFISRKDFLPRRLDRIVTLDTGDRGTIQWIMTNLEANPKLEVDPFAVRVPPGYTGTSVPAP